jgi:MFS family permease
MSSELSTPVLVNLPETNRADESGAAEMRRGWLLLLSSIFGIGTCAAASVYVSGVFIRPLSAEFGWSRGQISLGQTILTGVMALCSPYIGVLIDRFGEWQFIVLSAACTSIAYLAFAHVSGDIHQFWLICFMLGLLGGGTSPLVYSKIISARFLKARGTALSIALMGAGLNSMFAPGLVAAIVGRSGWRSAYLAIAEVVAVITPIVCFGLWKSGAFRRTVQVSTTTAREFRLRLLLRSSVFWLLAASFFLMMFASGGMLLHFVSLLVDRGMAPGQAAIFAGVIGLSLIIGRLITGMLVDRIFAPWVAAGVVMICAAFLAALALAIPGGALLGAVALGLSVGAELDLAPFMTALYFPREIYGRVYGILYGVFLFGGMSSALFYGYGFDLAHSYTPVLLLASLCMLIAGATFLLLPRRSLAREAG